MSKYGTREQTIQFWQSQDWSKRNTEIAEATGRSVGSVRGWRRRLKQPESALRWKWRVKPAQARCKKFNWRKGDRELGVLHGLSRERVRQLRKMFGKPRAK